MAKTDHPSGGVDTEPQAGQRRSFLGLTALVGGLIGALVGFPIGALFAAPLIRGPRTGEGENWVDIGPVSDFGAEPKAAEYAYQYQDGWYQANRTRRVLVSKSGNGFRVVSTECTHLGCGVTWQQENNKFYCPCHGAEFDAQGRVLKGPATEPLKILDCRPSKDGKQLQVREA